MTTPLNTSSAARIQLNKVSTSMAGPGEPQVLAAQESPQGHAGVDSLRVLSPAPRTGRAQKAQDKKGNWVL